MQNVVLLDAVRKILETFMVYGKKKSWKLYESENSENLNNHLHRYILFQHSKDKVTALEVLQDNQSRNCGTLWRDLGCSKLNFDNPSTLNVSKCAPEISQSAPQVYYSKKIWSVHPTLSCSPLSLCPCAAFTLFLDLPCNCKFSQNSF